MCVACVSVFVVVSGVFSFQIGFDVEVATIAMQQGNEIVKPLGWPLVSREVGWISSGFGLRRDPFTGDYEFHTGIDVSAASGTEVVATAPGAVVRTIGDVRYGLGLVMSHGYYETFYGHLIEIAVKPGDSVAKGDVIGKLGYAGKSTGPHLHYEVRLQGSYMNPRDYLGAEPREKR